ncbi:MAG: DUF2267 domain-containing protein [Bacteroidota bacterium]
MALNFEKYAQEGNRFINDLAEKLGHPEETARTGIILRAVMHTLRERITMSESLNLLSQLPMFLKGLYVENWKFREKPVDIKTKEAFLEEVEKYQDQYGEQKFSWNKSTEKISQIVIAALGEYVSKGEFEDIIDQMPMDIKDLFLESIK